MEWRACERLGLIPSGINRNWDENPMWQRALILAYSQIREQEEAESSTETLKALIPRA